MSDFNQIEMSICALPTVYNGSTAETIEQQFETLKAKIKTEIEEYRKANNY